MTITVRPLKAEDKSRWLELWHGYLTFYETSLSSEQTELTWNRLMDSDYGVFGLMAEKDGAMVGITHFMFRPSTWAPKDYCYLEDLFVDPTIRGGGAGRALISRVIELAKSFSLRPKLVAKTKVTSQTSEHFKNIALYE
jgi:GNAT superfamily N-acetyltransferase